MVKRDSQAARIARLEDALIEAQARYLYASTWAGQPAERWEPWVEARDRYRALARRGLERADLLDPA